MSTTPEPGRNYIYRVIGSRPELAYVEAYAVEKETAASYICNYRSGKMTLNKAKWASVLFTSVAAAVGHIRSWSQKTKEELAQRALRINPERDIGLYYVPVTPYEKQEELLLD